MARYIILAFTNPIEGREAEYHHWYDTIAVPAYKTIPGLVHHGRYRIADVPKHYDFARDSEWQYCSLYSFETDDYEDFAANAGAALAAVKEYSFSDTIDKASFFEPTFVQMD
ncbi:hypothetical protein [Sphingobium chlorophenolicum]|uniref:Ethyl tert-butyl ether degradation EthD n=1 Tax=Sphingobium chlorophenolicum TaxID=46429 RepID=A0A081R9Z9_SPHCR|nr:hypothetical protein [Sphingobium chlorophenolicum]KEQ52022.1 hypothetical protein BV95_03706 [Sphingobium chlorophenolicum]